MGTISKSDHLKRTRKIKTQNKQKNETILKSTLIYQKHISKNKDDGDWYSWT